MTVTTSDPTYDWTGLANALGITETVLIPRLYQLGRDAAAGDADALQTLACAGFEFLRQGQDGFPVFRHPPQPTENMRSVLGL